MNWWPWRKRRLPVEDRALELKARAEAMDPKVDEVVDNFSANFDRAFRARRRPLPGKDAK